MFLLKRKQLVHPRNNTQVGKFVEKVNKVADEANRPSASANKDDFIA